MPIITISMPMFATYRIMVDRIALFVKIGTGILKEKNVFWWHQLGSFDGGLVRIKCAKMYAS